MNVRAITPILNVADIAGSIQWFERLGWKRCWTYNDAGLIPGAADRNDAGPANFAAVGAGECEIFLCRGAQGARGPIPRATGDEHSGGVWMSVWVESAAEVDRVHERAVAAGVAVNWPPTNEPWGVRECRLAHPDGHVLRISAAIRS